MRRSLILLICALGVTASARAATTAADLGKAIREAGLDTNECWRVQDLEFNEEEVQFYLTSGYLIFGKPVNGAPVTAVFTTDIEGGDAEVLLLPPDKSERKSLAAFTKQPNLNEHFVDALFFFTDAETRKLLEQVRTSPVARRMPEMGALLGEKWNGQIGSIVANFESRMVLDMIEPGTRSGERRGFFDAIVAGKALGAFDVMYDPRGYEQVSIGQVVVKGASTGWETWTSFIDRAHRNRPPQPPEEKILSYNINATLEASTPTELKLSAVTRIRMQTTEDSQFVVPLDMSNRMKATGAKIDGEEAEAFQRESTRNGTVQYTGNDLLLIIPAKPLKPGTEHEIEIRHEGDVASDTGHHVYFVGSRGTWYPNRGGQFATYEVTWRYPKTLDLVSAGQVTEERTEGDVRITRRVPDGPIRLLAFNLGQFERETVTKSGVRIEVSASREMDDGLRSPTRPPIDIQNDPAATVGVPIRRPVPVRPQLAAPIQMPDRPGDELSRIASDLAAAVEFYRTRFGPPPVSSIDVSPVPGRFGQGFAGVAYISTLSYLSPASRVMRSISPYEQLFYEEIMPAHEVAHQWWGNVVTSGSYHHEWLMEALSNYSALMFLEARHGAKMADTILEEYRKELLAASPAGGTVEGEGPLVQGWRLANMENPTAWTAIVYGKGTWVLHMLRRRMGDAKFNAMLAELRRRYEWKQVGTEEFRQLCAEFVPKDGPDPTLEDFFDQWVYGTGIPTLKLTYKVAGVAPNFTLSGKVEQSDAPDDLALDIPVEIQTGRGKPVVRMVRTGADAAEFSMPVASGTAKALLDPGGSVLRR